MLAGGAVLTATGVGAGIGVPLAAVGGTVLNAGINKDNMAKTEEYNDPSAQMARYRAAGLNPNLIYGSSGYVAPPMPSSNIELQPLQKPYDIKQAKATWDNTKEMIQTAHTTRALQQAQTAKTDVDTTLGGIQVNKNMDTFGADVTAADLRNQETIAKIAKTNADTEFTIDANQRAALMQPATLAKTLADVALTKQNTLNAQEQNTILKFSASLSDSGINANTPEYMKIIYSFLHHNFGGQGSSMTGHFIP